MKSTIWWKMYFIVCLTISTITMAIANMNHWLFERLSTDAKILTPSFHSSVSKHSTNKTNNLPSLRYLSTHVSSSCPILGFANRIMFTCSGTGWHKLGDYFLAPLGVKYILFFVKPYRTICKLDILLWRYSSCLIHLLKTYWSKYYVLACHSL